MKADPKLRKWLNHLPRPVLIVCDESRIDAPKNDRGWAEVAESIEQLKPERVVCLGVDGKVLRAKPFEYFFPTDAPAVSDSERGEETELVQFARLLADAHKSAGTQYEPLLRASIEFNTNLAQRLTRTESELDRARGIIAKQAQEIAELVAQPPPSEGGEGGIAAGLLQGVLAAAANGGLEAIPIQNGKKAKS